MPLSSFGATPETFRAFLALDPDPVARSALRRYRQSLLDERWADQVKWVAVENLHLTVRFLGEITAAVARELAHQLEHALRAVPLGALELHFSEPRFFPSPRQPRVIACLVQPTPQLLALADLAERTAQAVGLPPEHKPFNGHITLGRVRADFPRAARLAFPPEQTPMRVDALALYQSQLTPSGPIYTLRLRLALE